MERRRSVTSKTRDKLMSLVSDNKRNFKEKKCSPIF